MIEPILKARLEPLARRRHLWALSRDLAICWAIAAAIGLIFYLIYRQTVWIPAWILPALSVAAAVGGLLVWNRHRRWQPDFRQVAREVEQRHPDLHALLLTAVEQQPDRETGKFNFLQERVINQAVQEAAAGTGWMDTVSSGQLAAIYAMQGGALALLLLALSGLRVQTKEAMALTKPTHVQVSPGDTLVERGNGLAILARFDGPLPPEVTLVVRPDAQPEKQILLTKSLNDPVFGGTIPEVTNRFTYHVTYAGGHSPDFKVDVFEFPRLERADAHLVYPPYTGLPEKTIPDTRRITAVQGSTLDLSLQLNKPVRSARLIGKDKKVLPLAVRTNQANAALEKLTLESSQIYDLVLVDSAGRSNKVPTQVVLEVLTNRAPELTFVSPRGDQRVSPLEEIKFQGETWDDFGVKSYGITYSLAGGAPQSIVLGNIPTAAKEKRQFAYLLSLESLQAQPDQFLSYYLWADDVGPDGKPRRTASDMFYAEVRPFDEIFREGQSQSRSESEQGQGSESSQLAELQKQIINATWKLQRDNRAGLEESARSSKPTSKGYTEDLDVIHKSQQEALNRAGQGKSRSRSPEAKALWDNVEKEMTKAADQLGKAGKDTTPLPGALASEQSAYQALLKLAAHEFDVSRGGRSGRSGAGQPNQRQLDQLDLTQSENRYENQRQASAQQNPEQREQLQVLSRLKELAQRQQDLNQRLQELQTALQEAKSEQEKEDIRRQLKRLREEEQQMLADVDELMQRMDRPENQSRMADARQQLEQTRNQVQRAGEMIDKQSVGQALSSGTRAERQLADLRDQFRKKNSTQFSQEMRQMRSDARDLAQKEDQVSEQLKDLNQTERKTLSDTGPTKQLVDQLGQQKQKMTNLMEQMSRVSQDAEVSEPLLSKELYDTLRKASQGNGDESLDKASQLLKMSFAKDAAQFEQRAHKEIDDLKQGVERAAQSVLGDETEALRLARNELNDLEQQLRKEMAQAAGGQGSTNASSANASGQSGQPRAGGQPGSPEDQANQMAQAGQSQSPQDQQNERGGSQTGARPNSQNQSQGRSGRQDQANQLAQSGQSQSPPDQQNQRGGGQTGAQPNSQNQSQGRSGRQDPTNQLAQSGQSQSPPDQQNQAEGERSGAQQGRPGRQPGDQANSQQNSQQSAQANANAPGQGSRAGQPGNQPQDGRRPNQGQRQPRQRATLAGQQPGQNPGGNNPGRGGGLNRAGEGGGEGGDALQRGPITGEGYADWSDRLRDVEEMLDMPDLRNEVAGAREQARNMRVDYKKHAKPPQWDVVSARIAQPLAEVRERINEELARRESKDSLVPIDRDPVPQKFSELVRRYYEKLGSGERVQGDKPN